MSSRTISQEIQLARIEKAKETVEAENYALRQRIADLENELNSYSKPLTEPVEVIGRYYTTGNKEVE